jgi:hypothetical protein
MSRARFEAAPASSGSPSSPNAPRPPSSAAYPAGTAATLQLRGAVPSWRSGSSFAPMILLCSSDCELSRRMSAWLEPEVVTLRMTNLIGLLYALEDACRVRNVVIIDCREPSVRPHSVATLAEELPVTTQVVLWGCTKELVAELAKLSSKVSEWLVCAADAEEQAIARYCAKLVG